MNNHQNIFRTFLLLVISTTIANADDRTWLNGAGGNFGDNLNWDSAVPDSNDRAIFDLTATYNINLTEDHSIQRYWQTDGQITMSGGFTLNVAEGGAVDQGINAGALTLTGAGTQLNVSRIFDVGTVANGTGTLNILGGATMNSSDAWIGRYFGGTSGIVDVNGIGSQWSISNGMALGFRGTGNMQIQNGGLVNVAGAVSIGDRPGTTGTLEVVGAGSRLVQAASVFGVGGEGIGSMTIRNGGEVESVGVSVGFGLVLDVDNNPIVNGTALVTGANSKWTTSLLAVGQLGNGKVSISDGGEVNSGSVLLGNLSTSTGTIEINSGGVLNSTSGRISRAAGKGTASVSGLGSQWNTTSDLIIGNASSQSGELHVTDGGAVNIGGTGVVEATGILTLNQSQFATTNGLTNRGQISIIGDSMIDGMVRLESTGSILTTMDAFGEFNGGLEHNGGTILTKAGSEVSFLGPVSGDGAFSGQGEITLEGIVSPGNSAGSFSFENDVTLASTATLALEIGGLETSEFDHLEFDGDFQVSGSLSVALIDGFELANGQEFLFANVAGTLTGQFAGLGEGEMVSTFGSQELFISYSRGDGNDIGLFTTAVPEPGSMSVLGLASFALLFRRKRTPR